MIFKRPWLLFFLVISFVFFTGFQFIRFGQALTLWSFLSSLPLEVSPLYQALTGLVWGVCGALAVWLLWLGKPKGRPYARILTVTYAVYYWFEQLVLMESPLRSIRWPFNAGATVLLILWVFSVLQHPSVNKYFGEHHER